MVWSQIEATPPHRSYLILSGFLITYVLFTNFIRNRLHLSEPPLALISGIILGPKGLGWIDPNSCHSQGCVDQIGDGPGAGAGWGWGDDIVQEVTRVVLGIQVFTIGVELPKFYASRHWKSVAMMLGPVMTFGWLICALFVLLIFKTDVATSLTIAACLTPTDPVLASSILSNSQFSSRVPKRIRDMISAESACNDGVSFPFLYVGIFALIRDNPASAVGDYFLITILWQCAFGTFIGMVIGTMFNRILRFVEKRDYIDESGLTAFYLLLALLCVGTGSTLGSDDFLVAFGAGYGFARDGWFKKKTHSARLPVIVDLLLNSATFVYLGTIIPWHALSPSEITPHVSPGRLVGFVILVLLFRRIPIVLLTYRWNPDIRTFREALFCGHFGPMGLGGLFLAIEARAMLETESSEPLPNPPHFDKPYTNRERAIETIWPVICFTVMISTLVHGLSVLALSLGSHLRRKEGERAPLLAGETDPLHGMEHEGGGGDSEPETEEED